MAHFASRSNDMATPRATLAPLPPPAHDADDAACGPGWYESSRQLRCGLDVREGLPPDAALDEWLGACVFGGGFSGVSGLASPLPAAGQRRTGTGLRTPG